MAVNTVDVKGRRHRRGAVTLAAAVAAAGLLSGCGAVTVSIPGHAVAAAPNELAAPQPATQVTPAGVEQPTLPRTTDPASGVSFELPEPIQRKTISIPAENAAPFPARAYQAQSPKGDLAAAITIIDVPPGDSFDRAGAAEFSARIKNGTLAGTRNVTVDGHQALEARIEMTNPSGERGLKLIRFVEAGGYEISIEAVGYLRDAGTVRNLMDRLSRTTRIPSV